MSVITDSSKIDHLLFRGIEAVYPSKDFLEARLKEGKQLTLYLGMDPTGPNLHMGHAIVLRKMREFQDLGHKLIILIGDFTGMIGDPTDKSATRVGLTREQVLENATNYKEQASKLVSFEGENAAELKYNSEWLEKMNFADIVELASHFTVQQLLERYMFEKRMEEGKPIHLHEFMYPVMQGYDCVVMDVDGEVGGNDQTFNMLAGRTLMKDLKNKEKFVLTTKLLVDASGKKMGKTEGNMVSLSDKPEDMFGKVMSWTDEMMDKGFELCTTLPMNEVKKLEAIMPNPRDRELKLAYEVVKTFLGEKFAKAAQENFHRVFQEKSKPQEIPELKPSATDIITVLA